MSLPPRHLTPNLTPLEKFAELKDLYFGKKMHDKALNLLREFVSFSSCVMTKS